MLAGVIPTEATERAAHDTLQPPANLQPDITSAVSTIVMQAMAMNREARPSTVTEFMDALIQAKEGGLSAYEGKSKASDTQHTLPEVQEQALSPYFKAALGKGNAAYYLTRFARFNLNWGELLKPSWNSAGFIFNAFWLLYRRIFGFGVFFFFMPFLLMTIINSKMIGLWCWLAISIVIGCYGNALYFLTLLRRISKIQQQFPGCLLHPLKLSRLASVGESSLRIPLVYFVIALIVIYANGPLQIWLSAKPDKNLSLISNPSLNSPSEQEPQNTRDDLFDDNTKENPYYDAFQYQQKADELLKISDWSALLEHSQQWCNLDRTNPDAWLAFGIANFKLAQFSLAQPAFETYFRLKPDDNDYVLGYLAKTYIKLKKKAAAEQTLLKVIALRSKYNRPKSSDDALYYSELGNIYFLSNEKKQEALKLYKQALLIEPGNEVYKSNVNAVLNALALSPKVPLAQQNLAEPPDPDLSETLPNPNAWVNESPTSDLKHRAYSSLSAAAVAGDIQAVQLLLDKGVDVNKMEIGSYPLIQAVKHKQSEMVAFLLKHGADINVEDGNGNKAILYSIVNGDKKTLDILTNAGAFHDRR
jgi:tetratricopeptide (TPR) repeat protein